MEGWRARSGHGHGAGGDAEHPAGCSGSLPPATSAGCHGNGGEFPSQAAGSNPCQASGCEARTALGLGGSKDGRKATPGLGLPSSGAPGIPSLPRGGVLCARSQEERVQPRGAGARPSAAFSQGLGGAERSGAARRSAAQPVPSRPPPFGRWRKAAGSSPPRSAAAAGARRMLRAPPVAGIQRPAPRLQPRGSCPPEPEVAPGLAELGGAGGMLVPPSPLGLQLSPLQLFANAPGTGSCSPTPPATRVAVRNLGRGDGRRGRLAPGPRIQEARTHLQTGSLSRLWTSGSRRRYPSEFSLALNTSPLNKSLEKKQPLFPPHPTPLARFQLS